MRVSNAKTTISRNINPFLNIGALKVMIKMFIQIGMQRLVRALQSMIQCGQTFLTQIFVAF